ncbi:MAG: XTP/dITP diphosphatase [Christensenellales bacterium]
MRRLLIATNNKGKAKEIKSILGGFYGRIVTFADMGLNISVAEDGETFEQNAVKKAGQAAAAAGCDALADDSGLCVDALGGAPGVLSARYAGDNATDEQNNAKLLKELEGISNRKARFVCVVALVTGGKVITARGEIEGKIALAPSGNEGFGYDPLFLVPEYNKTFAQMPEEIKNGLSHRARALLALKKLL